MTPASEYPIWKPIVIHAGYSVSEDGRIRNNRSGKILKLRFSPDGYPVTTLAMGKKGLVKFITVHQLVAESFIGPKPEGLQVNHIDGIKSNNHYSNLEYVTPLENTRHAWEHGLSKKQLGERCSSSKLTSSQVAYIKRNKGIIKAKDLARELGITPSNISQIWRGYSWSHI